MYEYSAKIINVVDGDTVDAIVDLGFHISYEIRIRLYGINTPETRTKDLEEKNLGLKAKQRVKDLIDGKEVLIKTYKDSTGKYGRILADIFLLDNKEISVNQILLNEGLAEIY